MSNIEIVESLSSLYPLKGFEEEAVMEVLAELRELKEKYENAKEDIRKLLCSEYGDTCQFCVHDESKDAKCCHYGGSGAWCCQNARWNEH